MQLQRKKKVWTLQISASLSYVASHEVKANLPRHYALGDRSGFDEERRETFAYAK